MSAPQQASLRALLWYEPAILNGLSWRLFGTTAAVALAIASYGVVSGLVDQQVEWSISNLIRHLTIGALIPIIAVLLINARHPPLHNALALTLATVLGCAVAELFIYAVFGEVFVEGAGPLRGMAFFIRQSLKEWSFAVALYYFLDRATLRTAVLREAELDRQRLEAQMLAARLEVMQAQVEPHFLFNTLAHVKRLYQTDRTLGRRMLDSFCTYLEAGLPKMRGGDATLGQEVDLVRAYLDIQRIRMDRRLAFEIAIPSELGPASFPSMMLLSLVENAIKHGLNPLPEGGRVRISADTVDGRLRVAVADTGAGLRSGSGSGVGLSNIRARLAALFGPPGRLILRNNAPKGTVASIETPLAHVASAAGEAVSIMTRSDAAPDSLEATASAPVAALSREP
jgi:signal transduction histidine kinase